MYRSIRDIENTVINYEVISVTYVIIEIDSVFAKLYAKEDLL